MPTNNVQVFAIVKMIDVKLTLLTMKCRARTILLQMTAKVLNVTWFEIVTIERALRSSGVFASLRIWEEFVTAKALEHYLVKSGLVFAAISLSPLHFAGWALVSNH